MVVRHRVREKRCYRCGEILPLDQFYKDTSKRDGLQYWCKACDKASKEADCKENRNRAIARIMGLKRCGKCGKYLPMDQFTKDKRAADGLATKCKACAKAYCEANKQKIAEYQKAYREAHREEFAEYDKARREASPDKMREYARLRRARKADLSGTHTTEEWQALCDQYPDVCPCCGRPWPECGGPTLDHIIPITWEGSSNDIENIQPLCGSCNSAKGNSRATDYRHVPGNTA